MEKKLLTLTEFAAYLGMSRKTLYKKLKDGTIPVQAVRGIHPKKWNIEDIDEWRLNSNG